MKKQEKKVQLRRNPNPQTEENTIPPAQIVRAFGRLTCSTSIREVYGFDGFQIERSGSPGQVRVSVHVNANTYLPRMKGKLVKLIGGGQQFTRPFGATMVFTGLTAGVTYHMSLV